MDSRKEENGRPRRILWIGGSKGGVGKSMTTIAALDYLLAQGTKVLLVECDNANPDVLRAYQHVVACERTDLDEADGWIHLVNLCDTHRDSTVVVNTAARNNVAVSRYGETLDSSLDALEAELDVWWVINRQRDGLELLKEFMEAIPHSRVHVVRNGYFGEERKFELYNSSKLRVVIEARGGKSVTLPDLADRVADDIYTQRLSLCAAAKVLPIGNRAELHRWRGELRKMLCDLLARAPDEALGQMVTASAGQA
jgi:CobQ/CobB/MinD/ParA nucleotide binding domain